MTYAIGALIPMVLFLMFAAGVLWSDGMNRKEQERAYLRGHVDGYVKAERDARKAERWSM
jgi:hypothetical protein